MRERTYGQSEILIAILERAAREDKWEFVDKAINEKIAKQQRDNQFVKWASIDGLRHENVNVRDLAASIIEKSKVSADYFAKIRNKLAAALARDEKNYAGFRAACALAEHGVGKYPKNVKRVLEYFSSDKDVGEIAKNYLEKISN